VLLFPQEPRPALQEIPTLSVTNSEASAEERDHTPGHAHHTNQRGKGSVDLDMVENQHSSIAPNLELNSTDPYSVTRSAQSDIADPLLPVRAEEGSASPALTRLRNSLRARFRRQSSKKSSPPHYRTTLAVSEVPSDHLLGKDGRSKERSKTAAEERYIKPRERGRGSFVVVKIKPPGPAEFLDKDYVKKMEENFRVNHLFGSLTVDVEEGMRNIIQQGQVRGREGGKEGGRSGRRWERGGREEGWEGGREKDAKERGKEGGEGKSCEVKVITHQNYKCLYT
jgi:hypothetical protein